MSYLNMGGLQNKGKSIQIVWDKIVSVFGLEYFILVDYWDADNYAFGITREDRLIYISTWELNETMTNEILCYAEFEVSKGSEEVPYKLMKRIPEIKVLELIIEIKKIVGEY